MTSREFGTAELVTVTVDTVDAIPLHVLLVNSPSPALAIPDAGSVTNGIVVNYAGTIGLVRVAVDISHSFRVGVWGKV